MPFSKVACWRLATSHITSLMKILSPVLAAKNYTFFGIFRTPLHGRCWFYKLNFFCMVPINIQLVTRTSICRKNAGISGPTLWGHEKEFTGKGKRRWLQICLTHMKWKQSWFNLQGTSLFEYFAKIFAKIRSMRQSDQEMTRMLMVAA